MNNYRKGPTAKAFKDAVDPSEFYLREQNLSRFMAHSGKWATAGICPFHDDRKAGSFKVNLETGAYKCWSCGASGGDIIAFVQKRDQLNFTEALQKLSREWGVS